MACKVVSNAKLPHILPRKMYTPVRTVIFTYEHRLHKGRVVSLATDLIHRGTTLFGFLLFNP